MSLYFFIRIFAENLHKKYVYYYRDYVIRNRNRFLVTQK